MGRGKNKLKFRPSDIAGIPLASPSSTRSGKPFGRSAVDVFDNMSQLETDSVLSGSTPRLRDDDDLHHIFSSRRDDASPELVQVPISGYYDKSMHSSFDLHLISPVFTNAGSDNVVSDNLKSALEVLVVSAPAAFNNDVSDSLNCALEVPVVLPRVTVLNHSAPATPCIPLVIAPVLTPNLTPPALPDRLGHTVPAPVLPCNLQQQQLLPWTSLFKNKPASAGRYVSKNFPTSCVDGVLIPPMEVIEAGKDFWNNYLVGFFLDKCLPYYVVSKYLTRVWKLVGTVEIKSDKNLFFFKFSCSEDRAKILESDPYIIMNKAFIITPWTPSIDSVREQVRSIRVWVKFTDIPTVYQPLEGLDWLAGHIGKLVCFGESTERRDRLEYAVALIEITPHRLLPSTLSVFLSDHSSATGNVSYKWKPPICISCKSFGHTAHDCSHATVDGQQTDITSIPLRVPLQKTTPRVWRVKRPTVSMETLAQPSLVPPIVTPSASVLATKVDVAVPLYSDDSGVLERFMKFLASAPGRTISSDPLGASTPLVEPHVLASGISCLDLVSTAEIVPTHLRNGSPG